MEEFLKTFVGKRIDVAFGTTSMVRGDVTGVRDGILYLEDEEKRLVFVSVEKVNAVWEVKDHPGRPGFVV